MLENWPPSKGPKPRSLRLRVKYQPTTPKRSDFKFELPKVYRSERREILSSVIDHHHDKNVIEKVGAAKTRSGAYGEQIGKVFRSGALDVVASVVEVAGLKVEQASRLIRGSSAGGISVSELRAEPTVVRITYPLTTGVSLVVRPFIPMIQMGSAPSVQGPRRMTVGYLLWQIANEYHRIYSDWRRYQVWGHALEDLVFERLVVKRGEIGVLVGSY